MKLDPWYDVVKPREDLRKKQALDASEFAVHLDQIREGKARDDYQNPERFFERTFLTRTLGDLAAQVVRRLSGQTLETSAVFNMATQFGGGKTHALSLLYHLAQAGPAAHQWVGVRSILGRAQVKAVPKARVAVFVGQQFDAITGRGPESGEPLRRTPWGEIAWQLGGGKSLAVVAEHDERRIAPGGDAIRAFLPEGPCLILLDEVLNYMSRYRKSGEGESWGGQFYNFLQNLSEEARNRTDVVLAASIPKSETTEMSREDEGDYQRLKHMLDRVGKAVLMSAETETSEIIRRRLFEWSGLPDEAKKTAAAFSEWAREHKSQLGAFDVETARERFAASYPFHPSVLSVFERKWQSLPRFQKTRGVLRLLALWVSHAYDMATKELPADPLIGLGTAPMDDPYFRPALFEELGTSELEGPVTTDIAGQKDAIAVRLDREAGDEVKKARLHQRVATIIFFESNGGQTRDVATLPEIRAAVGGPGLDIGNVETVIDALVPSCHYLVPLGNNAYKFSPVPNLNKMLIDRRATIAPKKVDERMRQVVLDVFKPGWPTVERSPFPESSGQVSDRPGLTLAVLAPEQEVGLATARTFIEQVIRDHGQSARTYKSGVLIAAPSSARPLRDAATRAIAWQEISEDAQAQKRLDEGQKHQVDQGLKESVRDLKEAVWKSYNHVLYLAKDSKVRDLDLGQVLPSTAGSIVEYIILRLREADEVTDSVGVSKLLKAWPSGFEVWPTRAARNAFFASPLLPRLLKPDTIALTIADGVNQGHFGFAIQVKEGQFDGAVFKPQEGFRADEVQFKDDEVLITAERAKHLIQPPHLSRIEIRPASGCVRPNDTIAFSLLGYDQHDRPFPCPAIDWSTTGGRISPDGVFSAESVGTYTVRARVDHSEATAPVEVAAEPPPPPPPPPPPQGFGWKGSIPPQKWMNFYTKVLSRFASTPGLKLEVSFQVPPAGEGSQAKFDEAKAALRELGLSDEMRPA
jgi:hypothetical protein